MTRVYAAGGLTLDWVRQRGDAVNRGPNVGGNAAYAAVGAMLAGASAEIVAVLGADYPSALLDQLAAAGIGTSCSRSTDGPAFRVLLDDSGEEREVSYLPGSGSNSDLDPVPGQIPADMVGAALHICAIPTASQMGLIEAATGQAGLITLDTVYIPGQIEPSPEELLSLARRVHVFLPSVQEVDRFWPGGAERALQDLLAAGVSRAIVKLGPAGSIGMDQNSLVRMPAAEATVVDTTGAGDSYCGAFCAALAGGENFRSAMAWGAAAASVVIEGYGMAHALTPDAIRRTIERYIQLETRTEVFSGT